MAIFRAYLVVALACLAGYTLVVGINHGWNLLPIFVSSIAEMSWSGQFNVDFMTFLGLSGRVATSFQRQCTRTRRRCLFRRHDVPGAVSTRGQRAGWW